MNAATLFLACALGWSSWDAPTGTVSVCSEGQGVRIRVVSGDTRIGFSGTARLEKGGLYLEGRSASPLQVGKCRISMPDFFAALPRRPAPRMSIWIAAAAGVGTCPVLGGSLATSWVLDLSGAWTVRR